MTITGRVNLAPLFPGHCGHNAGFHVRLRYWCWAAARTCLRSGSRRTAWSKVFPIGGGLWVPVYHPEMKIAPPYNEWTFSGDTVRKPNDSYA